jgi:hypothetical protein
VENRRRTPPLRWQDHRRLKPHTLRDALVASPLLDRPSGSDPPSRQIRSGAPTLEGQTSPYLDVSQHHELVLMRIKVSSAAWPKMGADPAGSALSAASVQPLETPMALKRITLNLARSKDHPIGSATHGYEFVAPLDESGHLDAAGWKANKATCTVRRFWGDAPEETGRLVHRGGAIKGGSWAFVYDGTGDDDDEAGYRFGAHRFNIGDYVSLRGEDDDMHTFTVAYIESA